ncbi:hypothetical protein B0H14DRAFT_2568182 [Mycena olivaceomarginata]|nr:hypothetical protein B0H14DRAFT_2568182 [Mycena olivaceomarginata]
MPPHAGTLRSGKEFGTHGAIILNDFDVLEHAHVTRAKDNVAENASDKQPITITRGRSSDWRIHLPSTRPSTVKVAPKPLIVPPNKFGSALRSRELFVAMSPTPSRSTLIPPRQDYPVTSTGWGGIRDKPSAEQREYSLPELRSMGMHVVEWDGKAPRPLVDKEMRIIGVLGGHPNDPEYLRQTQKAAEELEKARGELNFRPNQRGGRRGAFSSVSAGISFGGGQQVPGNLALPNQTLGLFQRLFALACFFRMAGFANGLFRTWNPTVHTLFATTLDALIQNNSGLRRNFAMSAFAAGYAQFRPIHRHPPHIDALNLAWGLYSAAGLFRWVSNGFRSDLTVNNTIRDDPLAQAERERARRTRWADGVNSFQRWNGGYTKSVSLWLFIREYKLVDQGAWADVRGVAGWEFALCRNAAYQHCASDGSPPEVHQQIRKGRMKICEKDAGHWPTSTSHYLDEVAHLLEVDHSQTPPQKITFPGRRNTLEYYPTFVDFCDTIPFETEVLHRVQNTRCVDDKDRRTRRLGSYRKYRRTHLEERRKKTRLRMAALRAAETEEQQEARREKNRQAQRRYRERFREAITHRARRVLLKKNAEQGRQTKLRPKARHYYSDEELITEESGSEDGSDCLWCSTTTRAAAAASSLCLLRWRWHFRLPGVFGTIVTPSQFGSWVWPQPQPAPSQPPPQVGPTPQPPETGGAVVVTQCVLSQVGGGGGGSGRPGGARFASQALNLQGRRMAERRLAMAWVQAAGKK